MARDAFEGYDEPINSDLDPEEALKLVMEPEPDVNAIEPELDE
jgi:hypothetical protein